MSSVSVPWRPTSGDIVYRQPQRRKPGVPARFHQRFSNETEARRVFALVKAHSPAQLLHSVDTSMIDGTQHATETWHVVMP